MMLLVLSATLYAQKEVTKFLGIPVDGTKAAMIQKLKAKGFRSNPRMNNFLVGKFNGNDVNVYIVTNKGKVCRIMVAYANEVGASDVINQFNTLCSQFNQNKKYLCLDDYTLPENEDISYEMLVNNKQYNAVYYQLPPNKYGTTITDEMESYLLDRYTEDELKNLPDEKKREVFTELKENMINTFSNRPVWFTIRPFLSEYIIVLFYDNKYNQANGEDL